MDTSPKKLLLSVGVVVVAGTLFFLIPMHGYESVMSLISPTPKIEVYSASRPTAKTFYIGEKLRFKLENASTPKVFWLFDEQKVIPGEIEVEFVFLKDRATLAGSTQLRRVDAFARKGEQYVSTSRLVELASLTVRASLETTESQLVLTTPKQVGTEWTIERAALTTYERGKFLTATELVQQASTASNPEVSTWITRGATPVLKEIRQNADGEWEEHTLTETDAKWFAYTLKSRDGNSKVEIVNAVKPEVLRMPVTTIGR